MTSNHGRLAVIAHAVAGSLGLESAEFFARVFTGEHAFAAPQAFEVPFTTVVGEVRALPRAKELDPRYETRLTRLAACALRQIAVEIAHAVERFGAARVGLVLGSSTGGMYETELAYPQLRQGATAEGYDHDRQHPIGAAVHALSAWLGLGGPSLAVSTACSSSAKALGSARRLLRAGLCEAVVVVGVDTLCHLTLFGFHALGVLSERPTRPFSAERDGITLGEGAACALVTLDDEAPAHVLGIGESSDAFHLSSPDPEGRGVREAMQRALLDAKLAPADIGHVNAHGTGTVQNDAVESQALAGLFQRPICVTSTKGTTGHLLGASGLTEALVALESLRRGQIPPTASFSGTGEPGSRVQVVDRALPHPGGAVLSNSFGFGGSNVSVVVSA